MTTNSSKVTVLLSAPGASLSCAVTKAPLQSSHERLECTTGTTMPSTAGVGLTRMSFGTLRAMKSSIRRSSVVVIPVPASTPSKAIFLNSLASAGRRSLTMVWHAGSAMKTFLTLASVSVFAFLSSTLCRRSLRHSGSSTSSGPFLGSVVRTERPVDTNLHVVAAEPHLAVARVGALEGDHDHALEELVQLEAIVAVLRRLARHDALVRRRHLERVVDLVGALEDVDHARHRELRRGEANVEGEVLQLGLLHRLCGRRARAAVPLLA